MLCSYPCDPGARRPSHETVIAAFLALIGERRERGGTSTWEEFQARNPDLLKKELLQDWDEPAVLASGVARRPFVLPRRARPAR